MFRYKALMGRPEDTYTRRISAVLVADVAGFSTLMGENDERTARDVRRMQTLVQAIVTELHGRAVPQAGDSIFASFESVVAAVEAALRIQRRLADDSDPDQPLQLRIGIHFGDVLELPEGSAVGDSINVAARLCALARPGTVCISDGVYRHVRARFDEPIEDLGRQRLKNISDPVHAYLIVPFDTAGDRRERSARLWLYAGAGIVLLVVSAWLWPFQPSRPAGDRPRATLPTAPMVAQPADEARPVAADVQGEVALGVMLYKTLGEEGENGWMGEALRDGLNSQLSGLSKVTVYSTEFIDFLISREGLSAIEAASKLGIRKMLSGSLLVVGGKLRIETHVVDVATGRIEASVATTGTVDHFFELQTKVAEDLIARLDLPVTPEERKTVMVPQSSNMDALKLLLEAEAGGAAKPKVPEPGSALPRRLARALEPAPAWADDSPDILSLLEQYRQAIEARDVAALAAVYAEFIPEQQAALQRYFDNASKLAVKIEDVKVAVVGDEGVVLYTRIDDFVDARTGQPMHLSVRLTKSLRRMDGRWRFAER